MTHKPWPINTSSIPSTPAWGRMKMVGFPWDFSETPASWRREAPALGQHTEEILLEVGYRRDEIAKFREQGVIQ
jgi:formyl-CoA transferase